MHGAGGGGRGACAMVCSHHTSACAAHAAVTVSCSGCRPPGTPRRMRGPPAHPAMLHPLPKYSRDPGLGVLHRRHSDSCCRAVHPRGSGTDGAVGHRQARSAAEGAPSAGQRVFPGLLHMAWWAIVVFRQRPAVECARFSGRPLLGWWGLCSRPDGSRPPVCSAVSSNRPTLACVGVPPRCRRLTGGRAAKSTRGAGSCCRPSSESRGCCGERAARSCGLSQLPGLRSVTCPSREVARCHLGLTPDSTL